MEGNKLHLESLLSFTWYKDPEMILLNCIGDHFPPILWAHQYTCAVSLKLLCAHFRPDDYESGQICKQGIKKGGVKKLPAQILYKNTK